MQAEQPPPLGIWGVELDGQLVAVLSDMGLMNVGASIFNVEDSGEEPVLFALRASTNIIAYALTRDGGRTPQLPPAAWMNRRPVVGVESPSDSPESVAERDEIDEEAFMDLDASLALVQAPLGEQVDRDLQLRIDGRYTLELLKTGYNGVLLHNLPPGDHWIELSYGGEVQQLDFSLRGGKVLTLNFALNRFAFMSQLRLEQQDEQVGLARWQGLLRFAAGRNLSRRRSGVVGGDWVCAGSRVDRSRSIALGFEAYSTHLLFISDVSFILQIHFLYPDKRAIFSCIPLSVSYSQSHGWPLLLTLNGPSSGLIQRPMVFT